MVDAAPQPLEREKRTIETMIRMYCRDLHSSGDALCPECEKLLAFARVRLDHCTFGADKPKCADCPVHCYQPAMREAVRQVMKHAGPRMLLRHPVQAIQHAMQGTRHTRAGKKRKE